MKNERPFKGKHLDILPASFTCLDIETTGLSPEHEDIIEVSAIRIRNGEAAETFSETINIGRPLDPFIKNLTGISDREIAGSDTAENVLYRFADFLGGDIILGHNVNFDINFLYDNFLKKTGFIFGNDFIDTLKIARKHLKCLSHHTLDDIVSYYSIPPRTLHRALGDCELTVKCYFAMREEILDCR